MKHCEVESACANYEEGCQDCYMDFYWKGPNNHFKKIKSNTGSMED